ncbi:MAG: tRNA lysidine(34) synthetase TilS [Phycisphaeraceae bacterium]
MAGHSTKVALDPLVRETAVALRERCGFDPRSEPVIAVACSGGGDSQALLRALCALAGRRCWHQRVLVAHVNHHLTEQSDEADTFLRQQATDWGADYAVRSIHPDRHGGNLEATARKQRHAALRSIAREHGVRTVALAHHADDQLETMLMRLMRGAGPRGLAGMAWSRQSAAGDLAVVRPMLGITHAEIIGFLERHQVRWFEDPLNSKQHLRRNRLRADVLPGLRALWPKGHRRALETADQLREMAQWMASRVEAERSLFTPSGHELRADLAALAGLKAPLASALLRSVLLESGVRADRLSARIVREIAEAVSQSPAQPSSWTLAGGVEVMVNHRSVVIRRPAS